jgi:hypothetical protein
MPRAWQLRSIIEVQREEGRKEERHAIMFVGSEADGTDECDVLERGERERKGQHANVKQL